MGYGEKRRRSYGGYASKGYKKRKKVSLTKKIKDVMHADAEIKNIDFPQVLTNVTILGVPYSTLHIVPQNVTPTGRVGAKVLVTKVGLRYSLHLPTQTNPALTHAIYRIMVLKVKNTDGDPIITSNILANASPLSWNQLIVGKSFTTLMDRTHSINALTAGMGVSADQTAEVQYMFEWFKDVNIEIFWNNTTGVLSENHKNSIQILAISNNDAAQWQFISRIRYYDA